MKVFFYGLFMDENLLATKGIVPAEAHVGFVDGYGLRIGARASLVSCADARAYGVVMDIARSEAATLYAEESVSDYVPEPVLVELMDGTPVEATCYNLPGDRIAGANGDYAAALLKVASRLGFPDDYLDQIRRARA